MSCCIRPEPENSASKSTFCFDATSEFICLSLGPIRGGNEADEAQSPACHQSLRWRLSSATLDPERNGIGRGVTIDIWPLWQYKYFTNCLDPRYREGTLPDSSAPAILELLVWSGTTSP